MKCFISWKKEKNYKLYREKNKRKTAMHLI